MFKKIYAFKNSAEAGMLISLLKSNGFHPLDLQTSAHVSMAGADTFYYVQVPEKEYESIKNLLIEQNYTDII